MSADLTKPATHDGRRCPSCASPLKGDQCPSCGYFANDPLIGSVLDGRYRIDAPIGRGGMGRVYAAEHLALGAPVAVKFLLGFLARDPIVRARFRREALALAKLRHPSVVSVLDFGEHDDQLYMVMERITGVLLSDRMSSNVRIDLQAVGVLFDQLLDVLDAAHSLGIVHRDIKPENIMLAEIVGESARAKLFDFGIAHVPNDDGKRLTSTGNIQGTPKYMSPEQCRGLNVEPPSDIYSLGVILFEVLAGAPPFDADEGAGLMAQHMFVDAPHLVEVGRHETVPLGIERVVRSALAKDPAARPTAIQMRHQLAAAMRGTDPDSIAERAIRERQRMASLSRSERSPTGTALPAAVAESPSVAEELVVLWMPRSQRATSLRDALNVNGIAARIWTSPSPPPPALDGLNVKVVVVLAEPDGLPRARAVRQTEALAQAEVFIVDALGASQTAMAIRAGAADVALSLVGDEEVCRKARRLMRART